MRFGTAVCGARDQGDQMMQQLDGKPGLQQLRLLIGVVLVLACCLPAVGSAAQDTVFPPGSRIGLTPPEGLVLSSDFTGFMDQEARTSILIASMPKDAFEEVVASMTAERLAAQGMTLVGPCDNVTTGVESRCFRVTQRGGGLLFQKWLLVARFDRETAMIVVNLPDAVMTNGVYTAAAIETALSSLAYSETLASDPLDALPFTIEEGELLTFQRTLGGSAAAFVGAPVAGYPQPLWIVASSLDDNAPAREIGFSRMAFQQIAGLSESEVTDETPYASAGLEGHILEGTGTDEESGSALYVFQAVLVDAGGKYYRLVGLVPAREKSVYRAEFLRLTDTLQPR